MLDIHLLYVMEHNEIEMFLTNLSIAADIDDDPTRSHNVEPSYTLIFHSHTLYNVPTTTSIPHFLKLAFHLTLWRI